MVLASIPLVLALAACADDTVRGVEINAEFSTKAEILQVAMANAIDPATYNRLGGLPDRWPPDEPPLRLDIPLSAPVIVDFTQPGPSGSPPPAPNEAERLRLRSIDIKRSSNAADELDPPPASADLYVGELNDPGPGDPGSQAILLGRGGALAPGERAELLLAPGGETTLSRALRSEIFKMWLILTVPVDTLAHPAKPTGKTTFTVRIKTDFVG